MDLYSIMWFGGDDGYDIHLLPGDSSRALNQNLYIYTSKDTGMYASQLPANSGITVTFKALLKGTLSTYGLTLNAMIGQVKYSGTVKLRNFLIEARVTNGSKTFTTVIRVNLHQRITAIWLTPKEFTLKKGGSGQRLTVLAEFEDLTSGDITRHPRLQWNSSSASVISFDSTKDVAIAPANANDPSFKYGALYARKSTGTATIEATFTKANGEGKANASRTGKATVTASGSWADRRDVRLVGGPGALQMLDWCNVLFLSDGFLASDWLIFTKHVISLVASLQTSPIAQPYGYLKDAINYWMAFIPSTQRGASILNPLYSVIAPDDWFPVPEPKPLPPAGSQWDIGNLIYAVGLPISTDKNISYDTKANEWASYSYFNKSHVNETIYDQWVGYAGHTLAFERDTALGIALGDRQRAINANYNRAPVLHPLRARREDLNTLLKNLAFPGGKGTGSVWVEGGQDDAFVFIISNGSRSGGCQNPSLKLVTTSLGTGTKVKAAMAAGTWNVDLTPPSPVIANPIDFHSTVFHELSHAFGLSDEYGYGRGNMFPQDDSITLAKVANLQSKSELVENGKLKGEKIKWRWPRMAKAGVLADDLGGSDTEVELTMEPHFAKQFRGGDIVRLRQRALSPQVKLSKAWMEITDTFTSDTGPSILIAKVVAELSGSPLSDFGSGSIVYVPVTEPPNMVPASIAAAAESE
ncbi:MAG: hypothetical protein WCB68_20735, partial [Pyrinomonadaceae bacterium]